MKLQFNSRPYASRTSWSTVTFCGLSVSLWDTHTHDAHRDTWLGYSHILISNILGFSVCGCIGNMWYFLWGSYIINNTQHAYILILNSNLIKNISLSIWQENESWRQFCMKNTALRIMRKVWTEIEFSVYICSSLLSLYQSSVQLFQQLFVNISNAFGSFCSESTSHTTS